MHIFREHLFSFNTISSVLSSEECLMQRNDSKKCSEFRLWGSCLSSMCVSVCVCVSVSVYVCTCVWAVLSRVLPFAAPWTVVYQAPLPMEFSRQEYWSGLLFPTSGDLPNPGIEPMSLVSPASAGRFFTTSATWKAHTSSIQVILTAYIKVIW